MVSDPLLIGVSYGTTFLLSGGIAYGAAHWIAPNGAPLWQAIGGFAIALIVGWLAGALFSALLYSLLGPAMQHVASKELLLLPLVGKCFWFAALGAGDSVRRARKRPRIKNQPNESADEFSSKQTHANNDAYGVALAEIEEDRLDKGVWARSFVEAIGDESKARAFYIKARAETLRSVNALESSRALLSADSPSASRENRRVRGDEGPSLVAMPGGRILALTGVAIIGIAAFVMFLGFQKSDAVSSVHRTDPDNGQPNDEWARYKERVALFKKSAARGEISVITGVPGYDIPKELIQWPEQDTMSLENSQTWWRETGDVFWVHISNKTPRPLATLEFAYGTQSCSDSDLKEIVFVTLPQPIFSGSQALVIFKPAFRIGPSLRNCLQIASAWQP